MSVTGLVLYPDRTIIFFTVSVPSNTLLREIRLARYYKNKYDLYERMYYRSETDGRCCIVAGRRFMFAHQAANNYYANCCNNNSIVDDIRLGTKSSVCVLIFSTVDRVTSFLIMSQLRQHYTLWYNNIWNRFHFIYCNGLSGWFMSKIAKLYLNLLKLYGENCRLFFPYTVYIGLLDRWRKIRTSSDPVKNAAMNEILYILVFVAIYRRRTAQYVGWM